jgi:hypothetical protein
MTTTSYDFSAFAQLDKRESRPSYVDLRVERARRGLSAAVRDALRRGVVAPTAFLASVDGFAGLAFARELRLEAVAGVGLVGCDAKNIVACGLLAVGNGACRALLDLEYDVRREVPLVILDARVQVVTLSRGDLVEGPGQ